jgi:uncharacterized protein YkwD
MATDRGINTSCVGSAGAGFLVALLFGQSVAPVPPAPAAPPVRTASIVAPAVAQAPPAPPRVVARPVGSSAEMRVVDLVNQERGRRGLPPLSASPMLMDVSRNWSQTQANRRRMYHSKNGYAENVACGQESPESVMSSWMNSRGHRANILSSRATSIGVGCARAADGRLYWTQSFQ